MARARLVVREAGYIMGSMARKSSLADLGRGFGAGKNWKGIKSNFLSRWKEVHDVS